MRYMYILNEYALKDYKSSLQWYLERSQQAADNFVITVENALSLICENPTRWRNKHKNFYELTLKNYPFTIIYTIEEEEKSILISAIYHNKRDPRKKYRKI